LLLLLLLPHNKPTQCVEFGEGVDTTRKEVCPRRGYREYKPKKIYYII